MKQEEIVKKVKGPCVILAGAGTGKTHTIIEKINYLITSKTYEPERIVCITFSNEAANNLLGRIRKKLPQEQNEPIVKTFHAFSADIIRLHGSKIGIDEKFGILDPDEAKIVLHKNFKIQPNLCHKYVSSIGIAKDLGITQENLENYLEKEMANYKDIDIEKRLESLQFQMQTLHLKNNKEQKKEIMEKISQLRFLLDMKKFLNSWKAYEKIKKIKRYLDYSDLNALALKLLKENESIAKNYDYIVVDEFQDTNKVQLDLLTFLAPHKNITVVGDLNQSIYRFRGAYRKNYEEFKELFQVKSSEIFNLDKSYRSPNKVLSAAHKLILNNYKNKEDCFEVKNNFKTEGEKIKVFQLKDGKEEARKVLEIIKEKIASGSRAEEICVMFRTHQQNRILKRLLEFNQIPFYSATKDSLLKQKSVKTALDYLTILNNYKKNSKGGEQAWWDLFYNVNLEEKDLIKIGKFIKEYKENEDFNKKMIEDISKIEISQEGKINVKIISDKIKKLLSSLEKNVQELLLEIYKVAGLVKEEEKENETTLNLNRLYELAKNHSQIHASDLESFIHYLDIVKNLGIEIQAAKLEEKGVRIMTLHATKGLEYETVIITNMAQNRFPGSKRKNGTLIPLNLYPDLQEASKNISPDEMNYFLDEYEWQNQLLEERRLCYVAFTRAKKELILTYASQYTNKKVLPSQFLNEIEFKKNSDIEFFIDSQNKYEEPKLEIKRAIDISPTLKKQNFEEIISNSIEKSMDKFDAKKIHFSPSALLLFDDCQKKYEYKYKFNMPEEKMISWEAIRLGSFVHEVLDKGVNSNFRELKNFIDLAKEMYALQDWESIDFEDAGHMLNVFFERNKNKYTNKSKTEAKLKTKIKGFNFIGFADRIDFSDEGLEIIDYKTGKTPIAPKHRNWQLGYYAIAAKKLGKVRKVTLDMLKQEKPLEFAIDDKGTATSEFGRMEFNIGEVEEELVQTAQKIIDAYDNGFKPCPVDKNCEFCEEYYYNN